MKQTLKMTLISFFILIIIFIVSLLCINNKDVDEVIKIGNYPYMPNDKEYQELVKKKWKSLGHDSKLEFVEWNSYDELPSNDLDLYIYDGVLYKSLKDKNILEDIDNIDTSNIFKWTNNLLEEDNKVYAVPFLLCSDFLIYNKDNVDLSNINYIKDINTSFTTSFQSMVLSYYINTLISNNNTNTYIDLELGNYDENIINELYLIAKKLDINDYKSSLNKDYNGLKDMNNGKYNSLYGFSENIHELNNIKNIEIKDVSIIDKGNKNYYIDLISIKNGITKEEEKLYTELIEVMTDDELLYDYLKNDNDYLYLMVANKNTFKKLSKENNIYNKLYNMTNNDNNTLFLYGNEYYEEYNLIKDDLNNIIFNKLKLE